jgi:23S rRNA pseudouridine1911/1915/1917 synthase
MQPPGIAPAETEDDAAQAPWEEEPERRQAAVSRELHAQRLDKAVVALAPEFSRNHLQALIERGHVRVEGAVITLPSRKVRSGQIIEIELVPTAQSRAFRPEAMPLNVIYEDAHLIVLDKAVGMVVHPAPGNWSGTLLNALLARDEAAANLPRAGIVHRLDKDTSGVMVVGKTLQAVTALVRAIAAREVQRQYLAIVHGQGLPARLRIDAPIARDPQARVRMAVVASGKPARTDVERVAEAPGYSALRCTLHTGRTHQIRVHLAAQGHPLVGDSVYGGKPALGLERQALHAARLGFMHPVTHEALVFECAPPGDFRAAWLRVDATA